MGIAAEFKNYYRVSDLTKKSKLDEFQILQFIESLYEDDQNEVENHFYIYTTTAHLYRRTSPEENSLVDVYPAGFYPVYKEQIHEAILTGRPLTENFLMTEEPVRSWLSDYDSDWDGLFFKCSPSRFFIYDLLIKKESFEKIMATTLRPDDLDVEISNHFKKIVLNGKAVFPSDHQAEILKVLYDSKGLIWESQNLINLDPDAKATKMAEVFSKKHNPLRALIEFGNKETIGKGNYKATAALLEATIKP